MTRAEQKFEKWCKQFTSSMCLSVEKEVKKHLFASYLIGVEHGKAELLAEQLADATTEKGED